MTLADLADTVIGEPNSGCTPSQCRYLVGRAESESQLVQLR